MNLYYELLSKEDHFINEVNTKQFLIKNLDTHDTFYLNLTMKKLANDVLLFSFNLLQNNLSILNEQTVMSYVFEPNLMSDNLSDVNIRVYKDKQRNSISSPIDKKDLLVWKPNTDMFIILLKTFVEEDNLIMPTEINHFIRDNFSVFGVDLALIDDAFNIIEFYRFETKTNYYYSCVMDLHDGEGLNYLLLKTNKATFDKEIDEILCVRHSMSINPLDVRNEIYNITDDVFNDFLLKYMI